MLFDRNEFKAQIVRKGKTMKQVADFLGIDESTLYRKIQADGNFTREEINLLIEFLEISEPMSIFFTS